MWPCDQTTKRKIFLWKDYFHIQDTMELLREAFSVIKFILKTKSVMLI